MATPLVKQIVCLANSRKMSGRCVAGRELVNGIPGGWVRPVSARPHEEVSLEEQRYENGGMPQLLDIIDIPLTAARPAAHQPENWLLSPDFYWVKRGRFDASRLRSLLDPPAPLWVSGIHTYNGRNDEIPAARLRDLGGSLRFIRVQVLRIEVLRPGAAFGNPKRRVQAQFTHSQVEYRLWVTDPLAEERYLAAPDGVHQVGPSYLTVSVGEPFGDSCYKLVAAVIGGCKLTTVYTIGHSTHSLDAFIALLKGAGVEAIADVRSTPFSRRLPHFNQGPLHRALSGNGIAYVPLGLELGGRGNPHSVRDAHGRISYRSIADSPEFKAGLQRLESGSARMRVALMCTERDPLQCHRGILVSRVLAALGTRVVHIRADGATETHSDAEHRLLRLTGARHPDLFQTEGEVLAAAYDAQEARIAHVAVPAVGEPLSA